MIRRLAPLVAVLLVACGRPSDPDSDVMGASAPKLASGGNVGAFLVGRWRMESAPSPHRFSLDKIAPASWGPFLTLNADGTAVYQITEDFAFGHWAVAGNGATLTFDKFAEKPRWDGRPQGYDSSQSLVAINARGIDSLRVDDDGQRLILVRSNDHPPHFLRVRPKA